MLLVLLQSLSGGLSESSPLASGKQATVTTVTVTATVTVTTTITAMEERGRRKERGGCQPALPVQSELPSPHLLTSCLRFLQWEHSWLYCGLQPV